MKVWVGCARGVQVAYVTVHHTGCTLVPPSTWAKRVPRVGLQLQPDGEFSLQSKHPLRLVAVHHWCLNTLTPPKLVQDNILAILRGGPSTSPRSSLTTLTGRGTWNTSPSRSRDRGRGRPSTPPRAAYRTTGPWVSQGCRRGASRQQWPLGARSSTTARPLCVPRPPRYSQRRPVHMASAPRCTTQFRNLRPERGATGSIAYPGPWPP